MAAITMAAITFIHPSGATHVRYLGHDFCSFDEAQAIYAYSGSPATNFNLVSEVPA
jgi:hypothetical protein